MVGPTCACGAVGKFVVREHDDARRERRRQMLEWRGGRVGSDRLALEDARNGVTTCPACQHRAAVFMLVRHARTSHEAHDVA